MSSDESMASENILEENECSDHSHSFSHVNDVIGPLKERKRAFDGTSTSRGWSSRSLNFSTVSVGKPSCSRPTSTETTCTSAESTRIQGKGFLKQGSRNLDTFRKEHDDRSYMYVAETPNRTPTVQTFGGNKKRPCVSASSTPYIRGENIFKLLDAELTSSGISWQQCMALGCDNANVMVGQHKGVFAFVKREQPPVFLAGCTLHIIHNGAKKAATDRLPPFEDALTDIYYYFQKSSSRLEKFKGDQEFCGTEERKMLKHVCTRWLSISRCLARMLSNWDALKIFFNKEKQELAKGATGTDTYAGKKVESVYAFVRSPTNRLFAHFLVYIHSRLETVLVAFRAEEPKIHHQGRSLHRLIRSIFECYLKPSALTGKLLHEVHYMQPYNVKSDDSILIGDAAECFLKNKDENHLRDERISEFYKSVKKYFQVLSKYLLEKLHLTDSLLQHAKLADPGCRTDIGDGSLKYFLDRFPCLLPKDVQRQTVLHQFAAYQNLSDTEINSCASVRIDATWVEIGKLKDDTGELRFKELATIMYGILTIPHSSAHCERVFSCVRKNRTSQSSCLSDGTLESLLLLKSRPGQCGTRGYTSKELDRFKSAYYQSLTG